MVQTLNVVPGQTTTPCFATFCCGGIFIIIVVIILIYYVNRKTSSSGEHRCPKCNGPIAKWSDECKWCGFKMGSNSETPPPPPKSDEYQSPPSYETHGKEGTERREESSYSGGPKGKRSRSQLSGLFKKKRVCDECGAELIYREEYKSWYCPNCHSYK